MGLHPHFFMLYRINKKVSKLLNLLNKTALKIQKLIAVKRKQIKAIPDSYILADNIEYGTEKRIPIWLLGFLY